MGMHRDGNMQKVVEARALRGVILRRNEIETFAVRVPASGWSVTHSKVDLGGTR
jgi:hypothetical protein